MIFIRQLFKKIEKLDFVVLGFAWNSLGRDKLVQLWTGHPGYVSSFQFFAIGVEKDEFWTFAGNLPESGAFEVLFKVLVDEFLHLGELIQTSPGARLDPSWMNLRIFAISLQNGKIQDFEENDIEDFYYLVFVGMDELEGK